MASQSWSLRTAHLSPMALAWRWTAWDGIRWTQSHEGIPYRLGGSVPGYSSATVVLADHATGRGISRTHFRPLCGASLSPSGSSNRRGFPGFPSRFSPQDLHLLRLSKGDPPHQIVSHRWLPDPRDPRHSNIVIASAPVAWPTRGRTCRRGRARAPTSRTHAASGCRPGCPSPGIVGHRIASRYISIEQPITVAGPVSYHRRRPAACPSAVPGSKVSQPS